MSQPNDKDLEALLKNVDNLAKYSFQHPADKRRAMLAMRAASDQLQHPLDKIMEMWGHPSKDACLKICIDVDLFAKWNQVGGVKTSNQLAEMSGIQPKMMEPILKHLATWHMLKEEGVNLYSQTDFFRAMAQPEVAACVSLQFECFLPTMPKLPAYLKTTGYARPTNKEWTPFLYAMHAHGSVFAYLAAHSKCGKALDMTMRGYSEWRGSWLDIFPGEDLIRDASPDQCLVVDVGRGFGHDAHKFVNKYAIKSEGQLVLQDQEHVLAGAKDLPSSIRVTPHDFFIEQPVKGARAYYLHQVLHDWPDDDALKILNAIKPAMKRGSSRVLVNEIVVPPTGASMNATTFDFIMMGLGSAKERTEEEWYDLLGCAGLKVVKIWRNETLLESVIECELA